MLSPTGAAGAWAWGAVAKVDRVAGALLFGTALGADAALGVPAGIACLSPRLFISRWLRLLVSSSGTPVS